MASDIIKLAGLTLCRHRIEGFDNLSASKKTDIHGLVCDMITDQYELEVILLCLTQGDSATARWKLEELLGKRHPNPDADTETTE